MRSLGVLIAEDAPDVRAMMRAIVESFGHRVIEAADGLAAVMAFEQYQPDIVLMDRLMPSLDGLAATAAIRRLCGARWVPIIMVSADGSEAALVRALEAGCDAYLLKPLNSQVLAAKISAFQRIADMQAELDRQRDELVRYRVYAEEELSLTQHIMTRLVQRESPQMARLTVWSEASRGASGDIVLSAQSESGVTYLMLADATGHGLSAAVTLIPVTNVFYAMTAKGFSIATIVEEMNRQVRSFCPVERFVALTLVAVRPQADVIEVWNGGTPPALVLDTQGNVLRAFKSRHLPLGILDAGRFSASTEFLRYDQDLQVALFSDGLVEAGSGGQYGFERICAQLSAASTSERLPRLQKDFLAFLDNQKPHDDITVALLDCPLEFATSRDEASSAQHDIGSGDSAWHLDTLLSAAQLRTVDVVPMVAEWSHKMGLSRETAGSFFVVLTELFVNALDHGILELPSAIKEQDDGFERYFQQRQDRLEQLRQGEIHLVVQQRQMAGEGVISIRVRDSGRGFSVAGEQPQLAENTGRSGRGIALVKQLCRRLEYLGSGNEVYAEITL